MKPLKEILTTSYDAYQPILWHNAPLQQYHPRIKGYLSAKLGKDFAGLFALPKIATGKDGRKIISWVTDELDGPGISLKNWNKENAGTGPHRQSVILKNQLNEHISQLLASSDASERTWGEMLSLCLKYINDDFLFVEGEKVVIAGWGLQPIEANDLSIFSTFKPSPTPSSDVDQLPVDQDPKKESSNQDSDAVIAPDKSQKTLDQKNKAPVEPQGDEAAFMPQKEFTAPLSSINEETEVHPTDPSTAPLPSDQPSATRDGSSGREPDAHEESMSLNEEAGNTVPPEKLQPLIEDNGGQIPPNKRKGGFFGFFRRWWWALLLLLLLALFLWYTCGSGSSVTYLPDQPNVIVPIDTNDIEVDDDSLKMIVSDRLNIALGTQNNDIKAFAKAFKAAYPGPDYAIIYYDTLTKRLQIRVPKEKREQMVQELPSALPDFEMIIWHESIFSGQKLPSDPGFLDPSISWYFDAIKADGAWDKSFGDKKIIVAIIDNGFDLRHPEFAGKIVSPWNVVERSKNVFFNGGLTHGTHVAGSAIANKNNGTGVSGIAPDCSFMPVQVADANGVMSTTAIIDGILYAINQGANVINLSLGLQTLPIVATYPLHIQREIIAGTGKEEEKFWSQIYRIAEEKNVTVVLAGGNQNVMIGIDPMQRSDYTINVAALTPDLQKADFSNFGEFTTLSAPGVGIYSSFPNNRFQFMDGTSMAAPIVTGAVALIQSLRPNLRPREIKNLLVNTGAFISDEVGPLIQLSQAIASIDDPNAIANPGDADCQAIQAKIDSLLREVDRLRNLCPDAGAIDTMKMPEIIENLDFSIGRWKSTTTIPNDKGGEVTLYFDFFPNQKGELTLLEPDGMECTADLSLQANQSTFNVNQLQDAVCDQNQFTYAKYTFACKADAQGYAACTAQNKIVKANRFSFKLVKIH